MKLEDFTKELQTIAARFPEEQEKVLAKGGRKLVKFIRASTPDSGSLHKRKLKKSWRMQITGFTAKTIQAEIFSKAPHFHLVERGHVIKTPGGKIRGFKQGTFFLKKTVNRHKDALVDEMAAELFRMVKGRLG